MAEPRQAHQPLKGQLLVALRYKMRDEEDRQLPLQERIDSASTQRLEAFLTEICPSLTHHLRDCRRR